MGPGETLQGRQLKETNSQVASTSQVNVIAIVILCASFESEG